MFSVKGSRLFLFTLLVAVLALSSAQSVYASWSTATRITSDTGESSFPSVASSSTGQYVYMVWKDNTPGNFEIYLKRSTNYGVSWSSALRMTLNTGSSERPSVACSSNGQYVYLVWADDTPGNYEIYFKRSTNYGVNWGSAAKITTNTGDSGKPGVACSSNGQYVYLAWQDNTPGNYEIYFRRSTNYGASWGTALRMTVNAGGSWKARVACSSNGRYVYLAWYDTTLGNSEIYFRRSTNYGVNWGAAVRITTNTGYSAYPSVACSSNGQYVYLVWADDTPGNYEIYFKRSTNYGASWGTAARITINTGLSRYSSVACSSTGQYVYLAWDDTTNWNFEIYFRRSTNYGVNWGAAVRITTNTGNSVVPSVACSSNGQYVYLVWADDTPGNYEIYLKKSNSYGV